jgi:hypothetical protein
MPVSIQGSDYFFIAANIEQSVASYFICFYFLITHKVPRLKSTMPYYTLYLWNVSSPQRETFIVVKMHPQGTMLLNNSQKMPRTYYVDDILLTISKKWGCLLVAGSLIS